MKTRRRCIRAWWLSMLGVWVTAIMGGCQDQQSANSSAEQGPEQVAQAPQAPGLPTTTENGAGRSSPDPSSPNPDVARGSSPAQPSMPAANSPAPDASRNPAGRSDGNAAGKLAKNDSPAFDFNLSHEPKEGFEVGDLAPEIMGEDLDGKVFRLSEYRGKVVVLDFWGNW